MNIAKAAVDACQVLMFDQWMRHYYVKEEGEKLFLSIPEEKMKDIEEKYPDLHPLSAMVNEEELTYEKSQATVCSFIGSRFDGQKYDPTIMPKVFDSKEFKLEMYVFNLWMKGHMSYLDENLLDFSEWQEMYAEWKMMDQVQAYLKKLAKTGPADLDAADCPVQ
ncbi:MAG: hypothetical protein KKB70_09345 [Proteobacteria bacterium]|nr:hypothetical protein [Pseudomonadota bacterium]